MGRLDRVRPKRIDPDFSPELMTSGSGSRSGTRAVSCSSSSFWNWLLDPSLRSVEGDLPGSTVKSDGGHG